LRHAPDPAVTLDHENSLGIGGFAMTSKPGWAEISITNYKSPIANLPGLVPPYYEIDPLVDNPRYLP
jgi:hypothetical protein